MCEYTTKAVKEGKKMGQNLQLGMIFANPDWISRPCEEKRSTNEVELSTIYFEAIQNSMLMDVNPFNSGTCLKFNTQLRFIRNCNILIQYCSNNTFTNETVFMMQHRRDNSRNISLP